jgi:hypothetical protein
MKDFSKPYGRVQYFGLWAGPKRPISTASATPWRSLPMPPGVVLTRTCGSARRLRDALDYLSRETSRAVYVNRFRKALDEPNPAVRFRAAGDACKALARRMDLP